MSGVLHPRDGVVGCRYTVHLDPDSNRVKVVLISTQTDEELDLASLEPSQLGQWLLDRVDW